MFEKVHQPLASTATFYKRLFRAIVVGLLLVITAEFIGMLGYHYLEGISWIDAFVSAAMILSGMGPMGTLQTNSGKIFAGFYALFSGLLFIAILSIVFAPVVHRFFHKMHLKDD